MFRQARRPACLPLILAMVEGQTSAELDRRMRPGGDEKGSHKHHQEFNMFKVQFELDGNFHPASLSIRRSILIFVEASFAGMKGLQYLKNIGSFHTCTLAFMAIVGKPHCCKECHHKRREVMRNELGNYVSSCFIRLRIQSLNMEIYDWRSNHYEHDLSIGGSMFTIFLSMPLAGQLIPKCCR